jgi:hypothetical protein
VEQTVIYQPIVKIKDDLFNVDNISQYNLCLKLDNEGIEVGVFDTKIDRCLVYEQYKSFRRIPYTQIATELAHLQRNHLFLGAGFWQKVCIILTNPQYTFVPEDYHHPNYSATFLRLTSDIDSEQYVIQHTQHASQRCYNHFAVPKSLYDAIQRKYSLNNTKFMFVHQTSGLLEGLLTKPDRLEGSCLHVYVDAENVIISFFRSGNLQYMNTFAHNNSTNDILYFVLLAMKEWSLEAEWCKCYLYGEVQKNEGIAAQLKKYVKEVQLSNRPKNINFGYRFDDLDEWKGFDVLGTYHITK